jgi:hypothetical protein
MATTLWTDPLTHRIVFFGTASCTPPSMVSLVTSKGLSHYAINDLPSHSFDGQLPPPMLPQVCWLYRFVDGAIELAPEFG